MAARKSIVDVAHIRSYLLALQDRLRLIEATLSTTACALTSQEHGKRQSDAAQVIVDHGSVKLSAEIKGLANLLRAWSISQNTDEGSPLEEGNFP